MQKNSGSFLFFCILKGNFGKVRIFHILPGRKTDLFLRYTFRLFKAGIKGTKFPLSNQFLTFGIGIVFPLTIGKVQGDGHMDIDGGKLLGKLSQFKILLKILSCVWFSGYLKLWILCMGIGFLDTFIFLDNPCSGFFSHSRNSRNIVGAVSHKSLQINKLYRTYPPFLFHILRIIGVNLGLSLGGFGNTDFNMFIGKL